MENNNQDKNQNPKPKFFKLNNLKSNRSGVYNQKVIFIIMGIVLIVSIISYFVFF